MLAIQEKITALQTANEIGLVAIEEKDLRIATLQRENEELRASQKIKGSAEVTIIALEQRITTLESLNKQLESDKDGLAGKVRSLVEELEGARYSQSNAEADARLREELLQLKRKIAEMEESLLVEKQRNMQLRLKSG